MFETLRKPNALKKVIDLQLDMLDDNSLTLEDRDKMIDQLERLAKVKNETTHRPSLPSADTMVSVIGHLIGIKMIVNYERENIVTSKAISFVQKLR